VLLLAVAYFVAGFYPYNWQALPKREYNNGAELAKDNSVQFKSRGILYTEATTRAA